jgi:ribosomal protein S18 acetylase RimI-like enzyme
MEYEIRRLTAQDLPAALALAWDTFLRFEAPDYGPEGVEAFRRTLIENEEFLEKCRSGENRMWGAFDGDLLIGLNGTRGESHICLVFTHHAYHRKGIATALFHRVLADISKDNPGLKKITLNSSPYGLPFYLRMGLYPTEQEKTIDGIRFTPMAYDLR